MEVKKSQKASLENKRFLFVEIGFVLALLAVLGAFEWSSKEKADTSLLAENSEIIEEEMIPITQETPPPPPEMAKIPILSETIDIVDDDIKVNDNIVNLEDDASLGVDIQGKRCAGSRYAPVYRRYRRLRVRRQGAPWS